MKDFSGYSDDDLLNELEHLSLEISCELGTERGTTLEKLFWLVMKELERRDVNPQYKLYNHMFVRDTSLNR